MVRVRMGAFGVVSRGSSVVRPGSVGGGLVHLKRDDAARVARARDHASPRVRSRYHCFPRKISSADFVPSRQRGSMLASILGIALCGGIGGVTAWAVVGALGVEGVAGAVLAAIVGMVVAFAAWTAGTALLSAIVRARRSR
jgi:hypothetical protein